MSPERWGRIQALFVELKDMEPGDRARRLGEISESDPELHSDVESLLSVHGRVDQLLGSFESLISQPSFESATAGDQETTPDPHGLIGHTISHYEVTELLGAGGMGVLYKAEDIELGRTVALKFLPPQWSLDVAFNNRFRQEARAVAALDHPNVCAIYEVGETVAGQLFISMPFYEGETVRKKIARGPLEVEEALELATQATSGLAAAHQAGVTHRDIKPANLIVTEGGVLKILDFGLAKTADATVTETGIRLGTPAYMSPQQTRGEEVDARTDLWSLGVVLYEMLTARRPFRADSNSGVIHAIRHEEPEPPGEVRDGLSSDVEGLVLRLLSKDPGERHAGAETLSEELASSNRGPTEARGWLQRVRRRSPWLALGSAAAAVIVAAVLWMLVLGDRGPAVAAAPDLVAVLPWTVRGESADLDYLEQGLVDLLSMSLNELPGIRAVDPYALVKFVERSCEDSADPECGATAAQRFGAGRFLIGTVVPAGGETFQLAASIYDSEGEELSRATVLADVREPLAAVEEVGRRIAAELLGSDEMAVDAGSELPAMAARTTSSLPALKAYLEGEAHFRAVRYTDAIRVLREAVAADSNFALAWYRLAVTATLNRNGLLADSATGKALERMAFLPGRYQALLQGFDYFRVGKADLAEFEFRNLLAIHANDPEAWYLLGMTQYHYNLLRGLPSGGYDALERALELDPGFAPALFRYRNAALYNGRIEEFDSLTRRYVEQFAQAEGNAPVSSAIADLRLVSLLQAHDDSTRERWFADLEDASDRDVARIAWRLTRLSWPDGVEDAARAARALTDPARRAPARAAGHSMLSGLAIREGRWRDANLELDALATVDPIRAVLDRGQLAASLLFLPLPAAELSEIREEVASIGTGSRDTRTSRVARPYPGSAIVAARLRRLAVLSTRLGEYEKAREYAAQLADAPAPEEHGLGTIPDDVQLILRADLLNQQGDLPAARAALDSTLFEARWDVAQPAHLSWAMFLRAEVLFQLGELAEAKQWYGLYSTSDLSHSRFLGPSLYRLGQIHEAMGEPQQARERYDQFVALWATADPELQPWVEDAGGRIEVLGGG